MDQITEYLVGGVTVRLDVLARWTGEDGRKRRRTRTVDFSLPVGMPTQTRKAYLAAIGRERVEMYFPADRYDSARWIVCGV